MSWARANNVPYFYFEAFDETRKATYEGPQGAHWGVWDKDGQLKAGVQAVFEGQTVADNWTGGDLLGGPGTPAIWFTDIPPLCSFLDLKGRVSHVRPLAYAVAVYIYVNGGWWTKPRFSYPLSQIALDGTWTADITTGGSDEEATQVAAFLLPAGYWPPRAEGLAELPPELDEHAVARVDVQRPDGPAVTAQPESPTVHLGETAALSVTAMGGPTLSYQWYLGNSGDTASPIEDATSPVYRPPALPATQSYWVRVWNAGGAYADSMTARMRVATTLAVAMSGNGCGLVTSGSEGGIYCGSDCTKDYEIQTPVTLTAAPAARSLFMGWSGDSDCGDGSVTMDADKSCTAMFIHPTRGDPDGNGKSDIFWRHSARAEVWLWPMDGTARVSETHVRTIDNINWEIRGQGDQTGDGRADLLWRNKVTGEIYFWPMDGSTWLEEIYVDTVDPACDIVGTGDFDGDGKSHILWRNTVNGEVWVWLMNGAKPLSQVYVDRVDPGYVIQGIGDVDANGKADIVWHHATSGEVWVWPMDGTTRLDQVWVGTVPDTDYQIEGVADFTGDFKADIVWWHATRGEVWIWTLDGTTRVAETWVATVPETEYRIVGTGDYDGDGKADLLWHHAVHGEVWMWIMDGTTKVSETWIATVPDAGYQVIKAR